MYSAINRLSAEPAIVLVIGVNDGNLMKRQKLNIRLKLVKVTERERERERIINGIYTKLKKQLIVLYFIFYIVLKLEQ